MYSSITISSYEYKAYSILCEYKLYIEMNIISQLTLSPIRI